MNTRVITGLAIAAVLVVVSCTQDRTVAPVLPTESSRIVAPGSCAFSVINNDARGYFSSSKDGVFALIDAMQAAYKAGGAAGATSAGFDVLRQVGIAVATPRVKGTPTQGSTLVNDVFACMQVHGYSYSIDFAPALGANGLFAVRNGAAVDAQYAVISRGLDVNGEPLFGAEKQFPTVPWQPAGVGKILFYGFTVPTTDLTTEQGVGAAFELSTLPSELSFASNNAKVGVCTMTQTGRILHQHAGTDVIPPNAGVPAFCASPPPVVTSQLTPTSGRVMQRVASLFAPKPLYAMFAVGGGSMTASDMSEFGAVAFTDALQFVQPIPNARVSDTLRAGGQFQPTIAVKAVTAVSQTPLIGVAITLKVVGNNGSYGDFNKVAYTSAPDGIAYFPNYYINKAGGYTITATSEFGTVIAGPNPFTISGQ